MWIIARGHVEYKCACEVRRTRLQRLQCVLVSAWAKIIDWIYGNPCSYSLQSVVNNVYFDWHHLATKRCCTCFYSNMYTRYCYLPQMHMLAVKIQTRHVTKNMLISDGTTSTPFRFKVKTVFNFSSIVPSGFHLVIFSSFPCSWSILLYFPFPSYPVTGQGI